MPAEKKAKIKFNNAYHKSLSAVLRKIHTNVQNNRDLIISTNTLPKTKP